MTSRDSSPNQPIGGDVNTVGKARINGDVHTSLKVGWLNAQSLTEKTGLCTSRSTTTNQMFLC